ncbi:hypothetical protein PoB_005836700 [Plakobranchus ocellatus]|uniref:Uncharacterized protein n=1 Tax=Plakobranchus ocellatus TaxID=259542 RepID=A0AAV4CKG0_9GAST|nr:hypothetical protein PoB_005836700 [Plakobranchus ocellatus]
MWKDRFRLVFLKGRQKKKKASRFSPVNKKCKLNHQERQERKFRHYASKSINSAGATTKKRRSKGKLLVLVDDKRWLLRWCPALRINSQIFAEAEITAGA